MKFVRSMAAIGLWLTLLGVEPVVHASSRTEVIHSVRFQPFTVPERLNGLSKKPQILSDRFEYWDDDSNGQFYVVLPDAAQSDIRIIIRREGGGVVGEHAATNAPYRKIHFLVRTAALKPGKYKAEVGALKFAFARIAKARDAVKFPDKGVPIALQDQKALANVDWPVRVGVPMPPDAVWSADQLMLYENGRRIPAQIKTRATWSPDGPPQWVHLYFVGKYRNGKPAEYRLKMSPGKSGEAALSLATQTDDKITVDTGAVKFEVNRRKFAGIEQAWLGNTKVIDGQGGPYVVDERGIRWEAKFDDKAEVIVEEQNEARAVILARGWLKNPDAKTRSEERR